MISKKYFQNLFLLPILTSAWFIHSVGAAAVSDEDLPVKPLPAPDYRSRPGNYKLKMGLKFFSKTTQVFARKSQNGVHMLIECSGYWKKWFCNAGNNKYVNTLVTFGNTTCR